VSIITGMRDFARIARQTSKPLPVGRLMSRIARSGASASNTRNATGASPAFTTA
jgi:hypothetical protein